MRPISAAGKCRPTKEAGKVRKLWADASDDERDLDNVEAEGELAIDGCDYEIMDGSENNIELLKLDIGANMGDVAHDGGVTPTFIVPTDFYLNFDTASSLNIIESPLTRAVERRPWAATPAHAREYWSWICSSRAIGVCSFRECGRYSRGINVPILGVERARSEFARRGSVQNRRGSWLSSCSCSRSSSSSSSNARLCAHRCPDCACSDQRTLNRPPIGKLFVR